MNFMAVSTEIAVLLLALFVMAVDLLMPGKDARRPIAVISIFGLLGILLYTFTLYHLGSSAYFFEGMFVVDNYAIFFKQLFLAGMIFTILFAEDYAQKMIRYEGEFYALLLFALIGMCIMASANDFLTGFLGLELMAISFYILTACRFNNTDSSEAGMKYLVIGSASTAIMLYGISLIYGSTGSVIFQEVCHSLNLLYAMGLAGIIMILIGFFFKLAVIPFHMWAPDVYQGAPTPVTALLAMGSKAAGIALLMRVLYAAFPFMGEYWLPVLAVFAAICMIGGNIMAIKQDNLKRMLAYSSIAQAGYMMVGIISADAAGMKAVLFYGVIYVFANVGAFAVLAAVDVQNGGTDKKHVAGLAKTAPVLAAVMTISLLSMAGIPPTAGFAGKIYLFTSVVERGYLWLCFVGFVMSMISVYYYLLVTKEMYLVPAEDVPSLKVSATIRAAVLLSVAGTIAIGVYPESLSMLTNFAAQTFMH